MAVRNISSKLYLIPAGFRARDVGSQARNFSPEESQESEKL